MSALPKLSEADWNAITGWLLACRHDPLKWITTAYPWGVKGTQLADKRPRAWQIDQATRIRDRLRAEPHQPIQEAIASGHGIGKVQCNTVPTPTPTGIRSWGDVDVGDLLFGSDGAQVRVKAKYPHKNWPFYRVTFDDGSFTLAGLEHLWNVKGRQERRKGLDWQTLTTEQIMQRGVLRKNGEAEARQFEIPACGAAQFKEREVDLHPFVMGVWLGDGTRAEPAYTKPYPELKAKIESLGYSVHTHANASTHRLQGVADLFAGGVFELCSHERYVPDDYKFNTAGNRRALLEGLLNSDGEVNASGSIGYSSTSERLLEDVIWLVRSLGGKAMRQPTDKLGWYPQNGERIECRTCYRATIQLPWNPFVLEHRKAAYKQSEPRYTKRWIDSIEFSHYGDGHCVVVEAYDSLYLTQDFIVTHNSCEASMLSQWALMTSPDTRGIITANTEAQLRTKTWPEVGKWFSLLPPELQAMFEFEATSIHVRDKDAAKERAWRLDAHPWSEHNTEAFAGLHNEGNRIIVLYDEASAIADRVHEVTEGALTDEKTEILWLQYGNPTRVHGRFQECWGARKHRWTTRNIDSRTVEGTNKVQLDKWVNDYGEDSDFVRVRVRGVAPSASSAQLIETDLVQRAIDREPVAGLRDPLIMSIDVARGGNDEFVIAFRRGLDARSVPWHCIPGSESRDSERMLAKVVDLATTQDRFQRPDAVFVDETGLGGPIVDRLRRLLGDDFQVLGVQFGGASPDPQLADMRTFIWRQMRESLRVGLAIPKDQALAAQLTGPEADHDKRDKLRLESKEDMKDRMPGVGSPDRADALAISFAYNVQPREATQIRNSGAQVKVDYDPWRDR